MRPTKNDKKIKRFKVKNNSVFTLVVYSLYTLYGLDWRVSHGRMEATFVLERHEWAYSRKIAACDAPRSNHSPAKRSSPDHSSSANLRLFFVLPHRLFVQKNAKKLKFLIHILYTIETAQRVYPSLIHCAPFPCQ